MVGFSASSIYDWFKRIRIYSEEWKLDKSRHDKFGGLAPVNLLKDAHYIEFSFDINVFNTKGKIVGLHRIKLEFVKKGILINKLLYTHNVELCYNNRLYTTLDLPPRQWVSEHITGPLSNKQAEIMQLCNALYLSAETAEGKKKKWFMQKVDIK